jgi:hypothetical protein
MNDSAHVCFLASRYELLDEFNMGTFETATVVTAFVQDANEVDDGIAAFQHADQHARIVNVRMPKLNAG